MEQRRNQILKALENRYLSPEAKDDLLDELIELEVKALIGHPGYPTLTRYYSNGSGLLFISNYVKSLVKNEGFGVGSALAQFDSNF